MKILSTTKIYNIKEDYWNKWNEIKNHRHNIPTAWQLMQKLTTISDEVIINTFNLFSKEKENISIIALGGYARREMSPFSDLDILILHKEKLDKKDEETIKLFTSSLWDINLQPGIQIKKLSEISEAAIDDEIVKTSFLDNRFLTGNSEIYRIFLNILNEKVINRGKEKFLLQKVLELRQRGKKYRDSIYRIQPNIKDGEGGIRDINTIYWISKVLFNDATLKRLIQAHIIDVNDYDILVESAEFLFKIRTEVHYFHNRKYDFLNLECQKTIANELGYRDKNNMLAVEVFLMDYYKATKHIKEITEKVIDNTIIKFVFKNKQQKSREPIAPYLYKYENLITTSDKDYFLKDPKNLIYIFYYAATYSLKLSESLKKLIKDHMYLIDETYIKKYSEVFLKTISKTPYSSKILTLMAENGVLQKFIPEFERIVCKPQFDLYHHYTVDEHTLLAVNFIDRLYDPLPKKFLPFQEVFKNIKRRDLLILAILLHDIGKGEGKNHSVRGANMTRVICKRLNMSLDDTDTVANLVEHHLLMSHISQRRDIHDLEVIEHFISHLNNIQELNLLYLLTYADMSAVGGTLFNEWKKSLLTELYLKAYDAFSKVDLISEFKKVVEDKKKRVYERICENPVYVKTFNMLEDDYIFSNKIKHIVRHIKMASELQENISLVEYEIRRDFNAVTIMICTKDKIGLLKKLAGAISYFGLNILGAQIYTFGKNIAVDTFQVSLENMDLTNIDTTISKLKSLIDEVLIDKKDIDTLLENRSSRFLVKKVPKHLSHKVVIDNNISSQYSVIDVYTYDYIGLLYDILKIFEKFGIYVQNAKISTDVDRVVDSFSITDGSGNKLEDSFLENVVKDAILKKLTLSN